VIEEYIVLAGRIRKELDDIQRLVSRANRAMNSARKNPLVKELKPAFDTICQELLVFAKFLEKVGTE
jgi:hypothetical protein